jgi:hypothetical protein
MNNPKKMKMILNVRRILLQTSKMQRTSPKKKKEKRILKKLKQLLILSLRVEMNSLVLNLK